jgi:hypothetical protein
MSHQFRQKTSSTTKAVLLCTLTAYTIAALIVPVKIMTQHYHFFFFSSVLLSLFAHLYGILQLEDTCDTSFGLCTCHFVSGQHHACATASAFLAILPGALARATGRLRMNKVGVKILPAFSIPILNPKIPSLF